MSNDKDATPHHDGQQTAPVEERAQGFVRPLRLSYVHVGVPGPAYPLRDLTDEERERFPDRGFVKFEEYPPDRYMGTSRFWTQEQLDRVNGCGAKTVMGVDVAEAHARGEKLHGPLLCVGCQGHCPIGVGGEFIWEDESRVGT